MKYLRLLPVRLIVLVILWGLPLLLYFVIGLVAIYQAGWLLIIGYSLPLLWLLAWGVGKLWKPAKLQRSVLIQPLTPLDFWTEQDAAAIKVVEDFRSEVADIDRVSIADPNRYFRDAQALTDRLAQHYHHVSSDHALRPLTIIEILSVIHLSIEDLEIWMLENVPGSDVITIEQMEQLPTLLKVFDLGQSAWFIASSLAHPTKLLTYPLWRKAGRVSVEIQNELIRSFYQVYLRQVGYYLIEMYSGRLRGGSRRYREQFGHMSTAVHASRGNVESFSELKDISTSIAVMGQVKAGKSSLINALMKDHVATISVLPETREVKRYDFLLPESKNVLSLLDTPGYHEADVSKQQRAEIKSAVQVADIVLLVMDANSPARDADVQMVKELTEHYKHRAHLRAPPIIAVLTHIDLLRPKREWSPPYDWREPRSPKEESIANAVNYTRGLFGDAITAYACVYTGDTHTGDTSVADEVVPPLIAHLSHGHSAAVLKAFYQQLSQQRFAQLSQQVIGLLKSVGRSLIK